MRQTKATELPDPMRTSAVDLFAEQAPKMQQEDVGRLNVPAVH